MSLFRYSWNAGGVDYVYDFVYVEGTRGRPYAFGGNGAVREVDLPSFYLGATPVSQAFWIHVMGDQTNPSVNQGMELPTENVSWDDLTRPGGFLDRVNDGPVRSWIASKQPNSGDLRLPSETEWEYAARGGPHWRDGFSFSGGADPDSLAWYDRKHGDHTQPVALKAPNQLGIYDMSGNVWEWCQDALTREVAQIPDDGTAFDGPSEDRILRGGCFHNWAEHCTVSKRYEISRSYRDGCIGFRLAFSAEEI